MKGEGQMFSLWSLRILASVDWSDELAEDVILALDDINWEDIIASVLQRKFSNEDVNAIMQKDSISVG